MRSALLSFAFLWFVLLCGADAAEGLSKKGKIAGESFVHLRSGPDVGYPSRAILRKGEEVTVEKEEGTWYLVTLMDGRKGYVHKTLVALLGNQEIKTTVKTNEDLKEKSSVREDTVHDLGGEEKSAPPALSPHRTKRETAKGKPLPIVKVLEGKEWEILWWLGAALCIFVIGWICGGNYYLRRDRIRRNKLHF